ncbi:MAG: hypothetical protein HOJ34_10000 [Kordiimonadaceae bacterium]|nr:hypothetical protein [Kordiimonadaceae bacterium]MBT6036737.1 hypothetical protein [Kordiimonadaceae bacterium]MBT6330102.1 hypothetical protein [Kordiimonadaceae bacterium]MBT7583806.1 hypothetical protein [Kordiimonadaceae bacterium]
MFFKIAAINGLKLALGYEKRLEKIMIIGKLLGYIFICLMIMVFGAEGLRILEQNSEGWITLGQVIDFVSSALPDLQSDNGADQGVFLTLANFSAFFTFMILGCILLFISRNA